MPLQANPALAAPGVAVEGVVAGPGTAARTASILRQDQERAASAGPAVTFATAPVREKVVTIAVSCQRPGDRASAVPCPSGPRIRLGVLGGDRLAACGRSAIRAHTDWSVRPNRRPPCPVWLAASLRGDPGRPDRDQSPPGAGLWSPADGTADPTRSVRRRPARPPVLARRRPAPATAVRRTPSSVTCDEHAAASSANASSSPASSSIERAAARTTAKRSTDDGDSCTRSARPLPPAVVPRAPVRARGPRRTGPPAHRARPRRPRWLGSAGTNSACRLGADASGTL